MLSVIRDGGCRGRMSFTVAGMSWHELIHSFISHLGHRSAELQRVWQAAADLHVYCPAVADPLSFLRFPHVPQSFSAYSKLRVERMNLRMAGIRAKRAKEAEAAEKDS
jgi:hypothetical protein